MKKKAEGKSPGRLTKKFIKALVASCDEKLGEALIEAGDEYFDTLELHEAGDDTPLTEEMVEDMRLEFTEKVQNLMIEFTTYLAEDLEYTRLGMVKDKGGYW